MDGVRVDPAAMASDKDHLPSACVMPGMPESAVPGLDDGSRPETMASEAVAAVAAGRRAVAGRVAASRGVRVAGKGASPSGKNGRDRPRQRHHRLPQPSPVRQKNIAGPCRQVFSNTGSNGSVAHRATVRIAATRS